MKLSGVFAEALVYACQAHDGQLRKGTRIPYVTHVLAVAGLTLEHGGGEKTAIAALLHDAAEDAGGRERLEDIGRRFGADVAALLAACSDSLAATPDAKAPWRERKEEHLARLRGCRPEVALIVACDKLHNSRSILADLRARGPAAFERFKGGQAGTIWYLQSAAGIVRERVPPALSAELDRTVAEIAHLAGAA